MTFLMCFWLFLFFCKYFGDRINEAIHWWSLDRQVRKHLKINKGQYLIWPKWTEPDMLRSGYTIRGWRYCNNRFIAEYILVDNEEEMLMFRLLYNACIIRIRKF